MKERPIIFNTPMVRAILYGRKTQTRRIAKEVRHPDLGNIYTPGALVLEREPQHVIERACPYGAPGERLWVRETWDFLPDSGPDEPNLAFIRYWADGEFDHRVVRSEFNPIIYGREKRRPSITMPRLASRITLEITAVRIERLHDISEADARAEGALCADPVTGREVLLDKTLGSYRLHYRSQWEQIHGPGSWDANPWVWAIEFQRVHATDEDPDHAR